MISSLNFIYVKIVQIRSMGKYWTKAQTWEYEARKNLKRAVWDWFKAVRYSWDNTLIKM